MDTNEKDSSRFLPGDNPSDCPYYLLTRASLQVTAILKKGFTDAGVEKVSPAYLGVLFALWQEDGLKSIDLGRNAGLEPSSMTGLIDRMERDELVYRAPDANDRRVQRIFLTDTGRNARGAVFNVVDSILSDVFRDISAEDLSRTKDVLQRVLYNAQARRK